MELIRKLKLPDFITLISLACAWGAIVCILEYQPFYAILFCIFSFCFDTLDGYTARKYRLASKFGRQLDSFVDLVNYVLFSALFTYTFIFENFIFKAAVGIFFLIFGVLRLVRMNIEGIKSDEKGESYYAGVVTTHLPPVVIIIYYLKVAGVFFNELLTGCMLIILSCLMVSKLKTYKPKNYIGIYFFCLLLILAGSYLP